MSASGKERGWKPKVKIDFMLERSYDIANLGVESEFEYRNDPQHEKCIYIQGRHRNIGTSCLCPSVLIPETEISMHTMMSTKTSSWLGSLCKLLFKYLGSELQEHRGYTLLIPKAIHPRISLLFCTLRLTKGVPGAADPENFWGWINSLSRARDIMEEAWGVRHADVY